VIYGEPQEVKIRFSRSQAPYIEERAWHPSQKIEKRGDGSIELTLQVGNLWEIKRWLIGYGADAQVLAPDGLRDEIEQECARLLKPRRAKKIKPRRSIRGRVKNPHSEIETHR
jgi:predicted DNA-binding transcriptional regulator YafY